MVTQFYSRYLFIPLSLFLLRGERATFCLYDKISDFSRPRHGLFIKRWRRTKQNRVLKCIWSASKNRHFRYIRTENIQFKIFGRWLTQIDFLHSLILSINKHTWSLTNTSLHHYPIGRYSFVTPEYRHVSVTWSFGCNIYKVRTFLRNFKWGRCPGSTPKIKGPIQRRFV